MKRFTLLLAATLLAAQAAAPEVEVAAEPHHHLTFENNYVRVFNVEVLPNSETLMHWHRRDYVFVTLGPAEIVNQVEGKAPITQKLADGDTRFVPAPFAHLVRDLATQPFRNVTIELLCPPQHATSNAATSNSATPNAATSNAATSEAASPASAASPKPAWNTNATWTQEPGGDRGLEILHGGTQQILFVQDGVRVSEFELQPGGVVPLHHHTGPHLLVAITDLDLRESDIRSDVRSDAPGGPQGPMPGHFKSGDSKWLPANYSHTITNTGAKPAKFVTLEFP
jgi:quercetin dioxygenase-like cupin family protein